MSSKHFSFAENCNGYVLVKLLQKNRAIYIDPAILTGYCHNKIHEGYLTKGTMLCHNCIGKICKHFEAFADFPYWVNVAKEKERQKNKNIGELYSVFDDDDARRTFKTVESAAKELGLDITIISVLPDNNRKDVFCV